MNEKQLSAQDGSVQDELSEELKPYKTEKTRVHNKQYAAAGHIYLVIKHRNKNMVYTGSRLVPFGLTDDQHDELFEALWLTIKTKYNL